MIRVAVAIWSANQRMFVSRHDKHNGWNSEQKGFTKPEIIYGKMLKEDDGK